MTHLSMVVQNTSHPEIHNRLLNRWDTESEDRNLYLSPAGSYTLDFQSKDGILSWGNLEMVINGEWTPEDNTTKMFMTNRVEDPRAIFDIIYGCSPENVLQQELRLNARGTSHGGDVCVRLTTGDRYELRYSPPGNTPVALKTGAVCIKVTLAIVQLKDPPRRL
ncbi:hypothetical protein HYFRA_00006501 [Hymenoscyphus fraxineus]|uniref:DUF7909 domain-containing protein n=1 Tax=Hymenoscyphus fraxineus TaxID=746836 RepID=A0A9N9KQX6_9HELO|nr:hypothetical protein HYFRA_00006501 [Hymenoscyphus fraxineus]